MRHERCSSTGLVMAVGLAALVVQGFMPPALPRPRLLQLAQSRTSTCARMGSSSAAGAARSATGNGTSGASRTAARAVDSSTELLLDVADAAPDGTPVVEATGLLETAEPEVVEGQEEEEEGEEEEGGWVGDSAELLSKGAGAIGAGVKSVALASKPVKREASTGRLELDGQGLLNLVRGRRRERRERAR